MATDLASVDAERRQTLTFARQRLTPLELELWYRCAYTERLYVGQRDKLQLVTEVDGQVTEVVELGKICLSATFEAGLALSMQCAELGPIVVWHTPKLVRDHDIFVWLPSYRPDFRFTPHGSSVNIAYRTLHAPRSLFGTSTHLRKA